MIDLPLISIIIPTYNRAHLISKTLESLLNQSYDNYEIIIVDDGSTDNTDEIVRPYLSDKLCYYKKDNAERAAARNFGTQKAKGEYINWFDSDDLALSNHISTAHSLIEDFKKPEWFHLSYNFIKCNLVSSIDNQDITDQSLIFGNCLSCNGVFVRKDVALCNPFNEDIGLSASEDYELWLRLASKYTLFTSNIKTSSIIQHDERSVLMSSPYKLINRFEKFIDYTTTNKNVLLFLSHKLEFFKMRNFLLLAVDLAANNHKKLAFKYLIISFNHSKKIFFQRSFYATMKHLFQRNKFFH